MAINVSRTLGPLQVDIKTLWSDEWVTRPNVEPLNGSAAVGGIGQFQFRVRYGQVKHPGETSITTKDYTEIGRDWIRVKISPYGDDDVIFMGRIESDLRSPTGPVASAPSGVQVFTAYDGAQILNKTVISRSVIETGASTWQNYDTLLPFNMYPGGKNLIKNMSPNNRTSGGITHRTFIEPVLSGSGYWTVANAIKYLISEFVGGSGDDEVDPLWQVTIPSGQLTDIIEPVAMPAKASVLELINQLIGRRFGWVWCVLPTTNGFNFKLSTVTASAVTFEGVSVPANPDVLTVSTSDPNVTMTIERSQVQQVGKIRVIGKPMVVVRSFQYEDDVSDTMNIIDTQENSRVVSKNFIAYILNNALWNGDLLPTVNDDGTIDTTTLGPVPVMDPGTMTQIPVKAGHDYNGDGPPDDLLESDFQPPILIYKDVDNKYRYFTDFTAASMYTLPTDIGIQIRDYPDSDSTADFKWYMTVAFEAAQRIQCLYEVAGATASDGEMVIEVEDAELWYLAKDMIYGYLDDLSDIAKLTDGVEIRNDRDKLYRVMAGAIARYVNARAKARMTFKGLWTYQTSLGKILGAASDATDIATIAAPITSVQWQFEGDYMTTVSTGFSI
jgi:hypothetical protein